MAEGSYCRMHTENISVFVLKEKKPHLEFFHGGQLEHHAFALILLPFLIFHRPPMLG